MYKGIECEICGGECKSSGIRSISFNNCWDNQNHEVSIEDAKVPYSYIEKNPLSFRFCADCLSQYKVTKKDYSLNNILWNFLSIESINDFLCSGDVGTNSSNNIYDFTTEGHYMDKTFQYTIKEDESIYKMQLKALQIREKIYKCLYKSFLLFKKSVLQNSCEILTLRLIGEVDFINAEKKGVFSYAQIQRISGKPMSRVRNRLGGMSLDFKNKDEIFKRVSSYNY